MVYLQTVCVICRECGFLSLRKISLAHASVECAFVSVYQPKLGICMHNPVDHVEAKHKVIPIHRYPVQLLKREVILPSLRAWAKKCLSPWDLSCCTSQSILISVFSSSFICVYERALHRWVTVFIPISQWFSVVTSGGVIISISKIVTATTYYGNFLHWNVNIFFPPFVWFSQQHKE